MKWTDCARCLSPRSSADGGRHWMRNKAIAVLVILAGVSLPVACATTPPVPVFKRALAVEYYDCDVYLPPCPRKDTIHVSIDPERFRHSVAASVYLNGKVPSKGSSLLRVKLPTGQEKDYRLPFGQPAIDLLGDGGSWIFEPGAEFEVLMGAARRVVFPLRASAARTSSSSPPPSSERSP